MVVGQITENEYIAAHILHRRAMQSLVNRITLIMFIVGIASFFAFSARLGLVLVFAALGGLLGECIQSRLIMPARLRRRYAQMRGRVDVTYAWNEEKLFLTSERGQVARSWTDFIKAKENDELVLLYINDALYEIIAKRWFGDAGDLDKFRGHVTFAR